MRKKKGDAGLSFRVEKRMTERLDAIGKNQGRERSDVSRLLLEWALNLWEAHPFPLNPEEIKAHGREEIQDRREAAR